MNIFRPFDDDRNKPTIPDPRMDAQIQHAIAHLDAFCKSQIGAEDRDEREAARELRALLESELPV